MNSSKFTLDLTGFLITLFLVILIVKFFENKLNISINEILVLLLLFTIAVGIHGLLHFFHGKQ